MVWFPSEFQVRVTRFARAKRRPTLAIEVPDLEPNQDLYAAAKEQLALENLEFTEDAAGRGDSPRALHLTWPDGGPLVISAAAHVIRVLESVLPQGDTPRCAAACASPTRWRKEPLPAI